MEEGRCRLLDEKEVCKQRRTNQKTQAEGLEKTPSCLALDITKSFSSPVWPSYGKTSYDKTFVSALHASWRTVEARTCGYRVRPAITVSTSENPPPRTPASAPPPASMQPRLPFQIYVLGREVKNVCKRQARPNERSLAAFLFPFWIKVVG